MVVSFQGNHLQCYCIKYLIHFLIPIPSLYTVTLITIKPLKNMKAYFQTRLGVTLLCLMLKQKNVGVVHSMK